MKKLLLAGSILLITLLAACKTKKQNTAETFEDSIWVAPMPGNENPAKYDSLKHELEKRRRNKTK